MSKRQGRKKGPGTIGRIKERFPEATRAGVQAWKDGKRTGDNPYEKDSFQFNCWFTGYQRWANSKKHPNYFKNKRKMSKRKTVNSDGQKAFKDGVGIDQNPYDQITEGYDWKSWTRGWITAFQRKQKWDQIKGAKNCYNCGWWKAHNNKVTGVCNNDDAKPKRGDWPKTRPVDVCRKFTNDRKLQ